MSAEPIDLEKTHALLAPLTVQDRLLWARDSFGDNLVLLSSMQSTASVLMHLFHVLGLDSEVLFVDTGYHFVETLQTRDRWVLQYRLNLVTLYPELTCEAQEALHQKKMFSCADGQPECCRLRKELPLLRFLKETKSCPVVVNGLRRQEGGRRENLRIMSPDPRVGGYSFSPLFDWSEAEVLDYIDRNRVPVHPLHAKGYPSVGCYPCTTPVLPGEPPRAGRWRHLRVEASGTGPQYCGLNFTDGAGI